MSDEREWLEGFPTWKRTGPFFDRPVLVRTMSGRLPDTEEGAREFLRRLTALSRETGFTIASCGDCLSMWVGCGDGIWFREVRWDAHADAYVAGEDEDDG